MKTPVLLSHDDLKARGITYSRASIYRKIKDKTFPAPVKLGENKIAWLASEIDAWIDAIAAARNPRAA
jgi:prophage regulatory protein